MFYDRAPGVHFTNYFLSILIDSSTGVDILCITILKISESGVFSDEANILTFHLKI